MFAQLWQCQLHIAHKAKYQIAKGPPGLKEELTAYIKKRGEAAFFLWCLNFSADLQNITNYNGQEMFVVKVWKCFLIASLNKLYVKLRPHCVAILDGYLDEILLINIYNIISFG